MTYTQCGQRSRATPLVNQSESEIALGIVVASECGLFSKNLTLTWTENRQHNTTSKLGVCTTTTTTMVAEAATATHFTFIFVMVFFPFV